MRRAWMAALGAVAGVTVLAAVAMAQSPVPTVAVTASPTTVTAQVSGPIPAGPTTFQMSRSGQRGLTVYVALLNAGVSLEQLQAALRRDDRTGQASSVALVSIQASVSLSGAERSRPLTFTLKPGLTYVLLSEPDSEGDNPPASRGFSTFTTSGASNGAVAARPDATVRMVDLRFRGARVLPRRGVVRVENFGGVPHFAIAFPLRSSVTSAQFGRALRANDDRALGRMVGGEPVAVQGLISGGGTANDQPVQFARAGRYALVCFFNEHHRLGMYRVVRVR